MERPGLSIKKTPEEGEIGLARETLPFSKAFSGASRAAGAATRLQRHRSASRMESPAELSEWK
jgi:hypothetical protein